MEDATYKSAKRERRLQKKRLKKEKRVQENRQKKLNKIKTIAIWILVIGGGSYGLWKYFANQPYLPPTTSQGHQEGSPQGHIIETPIGDAIQRHMIEHADGGGRPGILIQYNCDKFECGDELISNLSELVQGYPDNVYLAPNDYDGKIILTRQGKLEILEDFDEGRIKDFIEKK